MVWSQTQHLSSANQQPRWPSPNPSSARPSALRSKCEPAPPRRAPRPPRDALLRSRSAARRRSAVAPPPGPPGPTDRADATALELAAGRIRAALQSRGIRRAHKARPPEDKARRRAGRPGRAASPGHGAADSESSTAHWPPAARTGPGYGPGTKRPSWRGPPPGPSRGPSPRLRGTPAQASESAGHQPDSDPETPPSLRRLCRPAGADPSLRAAVAARRCPAESGQTQTGPACSESRRACTLSAAGAGSSSC